MSLFGSDLVADFKNLVQGESPRVEKKSPADSLILLKPTASIEHGGGKRFEADSWEYRLLHRWIASGAVGAPKTPLILMGLDVTPAEIRVSRIGETSPLKAIATWSDGVVEDVTPLCRFNSSEDQVAQVTRDGTVTVRGVGEANILVSYAEGIAAVAVSLSRTTPPPTAYPVIAETMVVDALVLDKLKLLGIVPSERCTDGEFLRRVSLDITGSLPLTSEVEAFLSDQSADKRSRKVDELLERPGYAAKWSTWLCDLTGNEPQVLENTDVGGEIASRQWFDWIYRRVADNASYYSIAAGILMSTSREPGEEFSAYSQSLCKVAKDDPSDDFAKRSTLPHFWSRSDLVSQISRARAVAYSFLGIRLQCAECHKHPFDVWTKSDVQDFSKFFLRIRYDINPASKAEYDAEIDALDLRGATTIKFRPLRDMMLTGKTVPLRELFVPPLPSAAGEGSTSKPEEARALPFPAKLLGGVRENIAGVVDPRELVVEWLGSANSPRFAQAFVNRVWAQYFSVGIVDPPDDLSLGNPPSNWQLLQYLSDEFVEHQYDMKWLHRQIANSLAYQSSAKTNETNRNDRRNFSHFLPRQMSAEVLYDAIRQTTATDASAKRMQVDVKHRAIGDIGTRWKRTSDNVYSLMVFGKPTRIKSCDCERSTSPALLQTVYLRNDPEVLKVVERNDGWVAEIKTSELQSSKSVSAVSKNPPSFDPSELVRRAYLRALSRAPTNEESEIALNFLSNASSLSDGMRDLMWALLNTKEFIVIH